MATKQVSAPRGTEIVASGVFRLRTLMANVYFVEVPGTPNWLLIDAGVRGYAGPIRRTAEALFGDRPPLAILLTHAHFDHVGSLQALLRRWPVPVYAHVLEFPHLTGRSSYPPPDPTVGGGAVARLSFLFPRGPVDVGARLLALSETGAVPHLSGWRWWHTGGHSVGHVSFFRLEDHLLIAGDAIVTTRQESLLSVLTQTPEVRPPPAYYTLDWEAAVSSVRALAGLNPEVLATGHGVVMRGPAMRAALNALAARPDAIQPAHGRYADELGRPRAVSRGVRGRVVVGLVAAGAATAVMAWQARRRARGRFGS